MWKTSQGRKVKENIKANKEQLKMSKYLATIVRDIDVGIDIKEPTLKDQITKSF